MESDLLTLTQAAKISGRSREALRLRVRRGKMEGLKGNDGLIRLRRHEVEQLPPVDQQDEVDGGDDSGSEAAAVLEMATMIKVDLDRARADLDQIRSQLDEARKAAMDATVRAEVGEERARQLQERLARAEADLFEARKPWLLRLLGR